MDVHKQHTQLKRSHTLFNNIQKVQDLLWFGTCVNNLVMNGNRKLLMIKTAEGISLSLLINNFKQFYEMTNSYFVSKSYCEKYFQFSLLKHQSTNCLLHCRIITFSSTYASFKCGNNLSRNYGWKIFAASFFRDNKSWNMASSWGKLVRSHHAPVKRTS